jgi:hypothetical protein
VKWSRTDDICQTLLFFIAISALNLQAEEGSNADETRQPPNLILIVTDNQNPDLLPSQTGVHNELPGRPPIDSWSAIR